MTEISGTNARFLNTPTILSEVMRVMEPQLVFLDLIPRVDTEGNPVVYGKKGSRSADGQKQTPAPITPSSEFPEVQITRMTKETALTTTEGLSFRVDQSALDQKTGQDIIMDSIQTIGYWMAEYLNGEIYSALDAGSTDAGITPAQWSLGTATPIVDLLAFKNSMKVDGYPYRMTDMFVEAVNFNELEGFLIGSDIPEYRGAVVNAPLQDALVLPIEGKPVIHSMASGVTHGDIMGLDRNHQTAATLFYHNSPAFSTPGTIQYVTSEAGKEVTKTVTNFGLSSNQFYDNEHHQAVVQLWCDFVVKVKDAYGIRTDNGL